MINIENQQEVDLDLDIEIQPQEESQELQRTEQWRLDRMGCLTGSKGALIMGCNRKGGKMSWADKGKIFEFSESIKKYIYSCAMERKTGRYIETRAGLDAKYGTIIEPLIFRRVQEQYLNELELQGKEVGFKTINGLETVGSSADGIVCNEKDKVVATLEFKACTNWNTHYARTFEKTDESSIDFWQMVIQMLTWNVEKAYYCVASPPQNIMKYIYAENPMEYYEDWCNETELSVEEIDISPIHIEAFKKRVVMIESCIQKYLATNGNLASIIEEEINFHKKQYLESIGDTESIQEIENEEINQPQLEQQMEVKEQIDLFEDSPF